MRKRFTFSRHADEELVLRKIPRDVALSVLDTPDQKAPIEKDLVAYQSKVKFEDRVFLLRLLVNESAGIVVTVYRTSKIDKYWRKEQ